MKPFPLLGCVYLSPSSSPDNDQNLYDMVPSMCNLPYARQIILGDFNFLDINWELFSGRSSSLKFRDAVNDCFLTQLVHPPTRGHSILDLVFTNDSSIFAEVCVIDPLLGNDHRAVSCRLSFCMSWSSPRAVFRSFDLRLADWDLFADSLGKVNWEDMFSTIRS